MNTHQVISFPEKQIRLKAELEEEKSRQVKPSGSNSRKIYLGPKKRRSKLQVISLLVIFLGGPHFEGILRDPYR